MTTRAKNPNNRHDQTLADHVKRKVLRRRLKRMGLKGQRLAERLGYSV